MYRRCLIAASTAVILLVAGCGTFKPAHHGEPVWLRHRVERSFEVPSHRVALAVMEVLGTELPSSTLISQELSVNTKFDRPDGTSPTPAELSLPTEMAVFWLDGVKPARPVVCDFHFCEIIGTDKEGREIQVVIRRGLASQSANTFVSVQVGRRGDESLSHFWLTKIADRVASPVAPPGSPEEMKALQELFGPRPGEAAEKARAITAGNLWTKRL